MKNFRLAAIRRRAEVDKPCDLPLKNGGGEKKAAMLVKDM